MDPPRGATDDTRAPTEGVLISAGEGAWRTWRKRVATEEVFTFSFGNENGVAPVVATTTSLGGVSMNDDEARRMQKKEEETTKKIIEAVWEEMESVAKRFCKQRTKEEQAADWKRMKRIVRMK